MVGDFGPSLGVKRQLCHAQGTDIMAHRFQGMGCPRAGLAIAGFRGSEQLLDGRRRMLDVEIEHLCKKL